MSGSRTKWLRREADGLGLQPRGWRKLKRAWSRTPRPERQDFSVLEEVALLRRIDKAWLEEKLRGLPREKLEALYRKVTKKK
jgi:hypothetical protein